MNGDLLGAGLDQREPQPEPVLQRRGGGQLRRGIVQADRPGTAAGQPRRHIAGAAAQFQGCRLRPGPAARPSLFLGDLPDAPARFGRRPVAQARARRSPRPAGPTPPGCAAHAQASRSQQPASSPSRAAVNTVPPHRQPVRGRSVRCLLDSPCINIQGGHYPESACRANRKVADTLAGPDALLCTLRANAGDDIIPRRTDELKGTDPLCLTVNPFHPGYASRSCKTWMALASCPARQGQQRSLRRIFQVLSWAFARSPGARSFAWARLASFWDSGLFFPLYGIFA